jgi:hypothetical protein
MGRGHERAHVHALGRAGADLQLARLRGERGDERIRCGPYRDDG